MMHHLAAYISAAGWLAVPLVAITFAIWFRYLLLLIDMRAELNDMQPPTSTLPAQVIDAVRQGTPFEHAFQEAKSRRFATFAGALTMVTALVAAAPMLGLLGTVQGIIDTFVVVSSGSPVRANTFGAGISRALVTTQIGLSAAIPGACAVGHLKRLLRCLENAAALHRARLAATVPNVILKAKLDRSPRQTGVRDDPREHDTDRI